MSIDELYDLIKAKQPPILYLTGKTCTGKSTFSSRLHAASGYVIIELDSVVNEAVIKHLSLQDIEGDVFVSVYKTADHPEWTDAFVMAARQRIQALLAQGKKVIVDGAIANPGVIRCVFDGLPDRLFIYFHPQAASSDYRRNLTSRFMGTGAHDRNGLPNAFWECIDKALFARFCQDRVLTSRLVQGIADYAQHSAIESATRLESLQAAFPAITIVKV
jgi:guanylate kinase